MISAVILSHNDQDILQDALTSVAWCDEIIVIDDASADATRDVAKKAGATVYEHPLGGDFAAQRNWGLSKAKGDWVLFLDSDERVSGELAREIQQQITQEGDTNGYVLKRQDAIWGRVLRYGETANVMLLRLARKGAGKWARAVHEVWDVNGPTKTLPYPLLHFPHPDVAQFISDIDRYSTMNAKLYYDQGKRSSLWQIVAYPSAKFFVNYFFRFGFLDGVPGMLMAGMMSFHSFLTRAKLYFLS